jgi:hypothetical protein
MQEDVWTNTKTQVGHGVTGPLGSPRAWLRRALNEANLIDTTFTEGSLTTYEISVAGIWYKRPEGYGLPVTGMHRELFRWYDIPLPEKMNRSKPTDLVPALGLCAAVPMGEVMKWLKIYEQHGAAFTWWKRPTNQAQRAVGEGLVMRRVLDHGRVYDMLDAGKTQAEIAKALDFPEANIYYVAKKWRAGVELKSRKHIDHVVVLQDNAAGMSVDDMALKHDTSRSYIYRIIGGAK